jgi:hypothetical protein
MSFDTINRDRHTWLLRMGLKQAQLREFFRSQHKALLAHGEPLRNIPGTPDAAIRIVLGFKAKGRRVFGEWLRKLQMEPSAKVLLGLAETFRSIESSDSQLDRDAIHSLARDGLMALYSESPPRDWLEFLGSPMAEERHKGAADKGGTNALPAQAIPAALSDDDLVNLAKALSGASPDTQPSAQLRAILDVIGTLAPTRGKQLAGQIDAAKYPATAAYLAEQSARVDLAAAFGTHPKPISDEDVLDLDVAHSEVIARCYHVSPGGTAFLDVLAVIVGGRAVAVTNQDARRLIPEEGRIVLYPDSGLPCPAIGASAAYRVERLKKSQGIRAKAVELGHSLFLVERLPFSTDDPDSVREAIKSWAGKPRYHRVVFVTRDGLCIRSRLEPLSRLSSDSAFDDSLDAWSSLSSWIIEGKEYVVGTLPAPDKSFDCATPIVLTRRLLKRATERGISLNKGQLQQLLDRLPELETDAQRRARFERVVSGIATAISADEAILAQLMALPAVSHEIELRKAEIVAEHSRTERMESEHLVELRRQKQAIEKDIEQLTDQRRELVKSTRTAVRNAFDKARLHELETVEQLAILQSFISGGRPDRRRSADVGPILSVNALTPERASFSDALRRFGLCDLSARAFSDALELAREWSTPVVIEGPGANHIGRVFARALSSVRVMEVSISAGIISAGVLEEVLRKESDADIFLLTGANLSDVSCYAPVVLEEAVDSLLLAANVGGRRFVLTSALGAAALPWPAELTDLSLKLHLGVANNITKLREQAQAVLDSSTKEDVSPLRRKLLRRLADRIDAESKDSLYAAFFEGAIKGTSA